MVVEVEFTEMRTERFRCVRFQVIDSSSHTVEAALCKDGEKVLRIRKIKVVDSTGKSHEPTLPPQQPPTEAPTESSDDSKGNLSLFQPLGL